MKGCIIIYKTKLSTDSTLNNLNMLKQDLLNVQSTASMYSTTIMDS